MFCMPVRESLLKGALVCLGKRIGNGSQLNILNEPWLLRETLGDDHGLVELTVLNWYSSLLKHMPYTPTAINGCDNDGIAHSFNCICCNLVIHGTLSTFDKCPVQHGILAKLFVGIWVNSDVSPSTYDQHSVYSRTGL